MSEPEGSKTYPAIRFLIRYGHALALVTAFAVLLAGLLAALAGYGWGWAAASLLGAVVTYLILRGYAELVSIIADTLLPR